MDLLVALIVVFLALWLLGVSFASSVGSLVHLILVIVVMLIVVRLIRGQPL